MVLMMPLMPEKLSMESAAPATTAADPTIGAAPLAGMAVLSLGLEVLVIVGSATGGNKVK
jgi:hypothetical protein